MCQHVTSINHESWTFARFFLYTVYKVRDKTLKKHLKNSLGIHLD